MTDMSDTDIRDDGDFIEQLQPDDTLIDRGVDDVLDEGYTTPENWSALQGYGNTPAEMRQRETIEMRAPQEELPRPVLDAPDQDYSRERELITKWPVRAAALAPVFPGRLSATSQEPMP